MNHSIYDPPEADIANYCGLARSNASQREAVGQTDTQTERERMEHKWEFTEELKSSGMSVGYCTM